jgi:hypothetical protein
MSENASHNKQGSKGYRDYIIGKLELPADIVYEQFPKSGHETVAKEVDDISKDFAVLDTPADRGMPKGNPEIEHQPEAKIYSKSHSFESATTIQGNKTAKTPTFGKTDPTADKQ